VSTSLLSTNSNEANVPPQYNTSMVNHALLVTTMHSYVGYALTRI
jgi:hypothetical protein